MNSSRIFIVLTVVIAIVTADGDNYIIGGQNARPGQFPAMVALRWATGIHLCGGVIVNRNWVLTSAYCVVNRSIQNLRVVTNPMGQGGGTVYRARKTARHPRYDPRLRTNDLGFVNADRPFEYSVVVRPVRLALADVPDIDGEPLFVVGLGLTRVRSNSTMPDAINLSSILIQTVS